jgi:hypothetical protein
MVFRDTQLQENPELALQLERVRSFLSYIRFSEA